MGMIRVSEKLKGWLNAVDMNYKELARVLDYDEGFVAAMLKGTKEPTKQLMKKIMDITCLDITVFTYERTKKTKKGHS